MDLRTRKRVAKIEDTHCSRGLNGVEYSEAVATEYRTSSICPQCSLGFWTLFEVITAPEAPTGTEVSDYYVVSNAQDA